MLRLGYLWNGKVIVDRVATLIAERKNIWMEVFFCLENAFDIC